MHKLKFSLAMMLFYIKQFKSRGICNGLNVLWFCFMSIWQKDKLKYWTKHQEQNMKFLKENIHISSPTNTEEEITEYCIWVMWWQGEDNMPELVHNCYMSIKRNTSHKVILITKNNYTQYVDLNPVVIEKVKKGFITLTHLSDHIRIALLEKNGGLWIDSTVLCNSKIPDDVFTMKLFTVHDPIYTGQYYPCGRWNGQVLGTNKKHMKLFNLTKQLLEQYWMKYDFICDYFLLDYLIGLLYDNDKDIRELIDSVPYNNTKMFYLWNVLYEKFDEKYFSDLCKDTYLFKLTYKLFDKTKLTKDCYYNFIFHNNEYLYGERNDTQTYKL